MFLVKYCWVVLLLTEKQLITSVVHLPREIEEGPNGNIIINLGGIPDPSSRPFSSSTLAVLRAKSRGAQTLKLDAATKSEEEYDYESYNTTAQSPPKPTTIKRKKKAKSNNRQTLLQWLTELVPKQHATPSDAANFLQLFDQAALTNDRLAVSTPPLLDVGVLETTPILSNAEASLDSLQAQKISKERIALNGGCKNWRDFRRIAAPSQLTKTRHDGGVKKPYRSTEPLRTFDKSATSSAIIGSNAPLPLPECFTNQLGMVCCNKVLENLIYRADDAMIHANVNKCNVEIFSKLVRDLVEKQFQRTFEIIVGNGPFAAKIRFKENLLCETIVSSKYVLVYASPESYALASYNVETPFAH